MTRWSFPLIAALLSAQTRPSFEVASVRSAPKGCRSSASQARVSGCSTLEARIQIAYNLAAFGPHRRQGRRLAILGAPDWVRMDLYEINAKASGDPPPDRMYGPMMQVLLEDRFKLKIRRETREMPVYILAIAKSGLKIKALKEGSCVPPDLNQPLDDPSKECGYWSASAKPNITMDSRGETMSDFAADLSNWGSDRVVIDRTGLKALFNIHLEFSMDDLSSSGPSLFTALPEQLGLKLTAGKGPVEVLVIDHVEKPAAN